MTAIAPRSTDATAATAAAPTARPAYAAIPCADRRASSCARCSTPAPASG